MVQFLNKKKHKFFGPLTRCKPNVDNMLIFFNICPKGTVLNKTKSNHSLVFTSLIFLFSFVFTLNFSKHGCNGRDEEETYFALRIIHHFVDACETCCRHSNIAFARRVGE